VSQDRLVFYHHVVYLSGTIFLIEIVTHLGDLRGDARLGFELLEFLDQQLVGIESLKLACFERPRGGRALIDLVCSNILQREPGGTGGLTVFCHRTALCPLR